MVMELMQADAYLNIYCRIFPQSDRYLLRGVLANDYYETEDVA